MGQVYRYRCPVETWRLLSFVGITFIVIISFQHFELPSGNFLPSMPSVHTDQAAENGRVSTTGALLKTETVDNRTHFNAINFTSANDSQGKQIDEDVNDDFASDANVVSNKSSVIMDNHDKGSSLRQGVQPNVQPDADPVKNSGDRHEPDRNGENFSPENVTSSMEETITSDAKNGLILEESVSLNESSGIDTHNNGSSVEQVVQTNVHSTVDAVNRSKPGGLEQNFHEESMDFLPENTRTSDSGIASIVPALPQEDSSPNITFPSNVGTNIATPVADSDPNTSAMEKDATPILDNNGKSGDVKNQVTALNDNPSEIPVFHKKKMPETRISGVVSVSDMNNLLLQSWSSPSLVRPPRWASPVDQELLRVKSQIENAPIIENDPTLYAPLYWNVSMFKRSYELMEQTLKVFIYKEGEKPILHQPVLKGIYASEGWFMKLLKANKKMVTKKPRQAHLFYLPFSSRNLELQLYVPDSHNHKNLIKYLRSYLDLIMAKYPFWNRTHGVDHFLVACHDWAPSETRAVMSNCIRALCNSDVKEGFVFGKDASLPETNVRTPQNPLRDLGGKPPSKRSILAFFAGGMHGYLRPILLKHWGNTDPDMKIFGRMPKSRREMNYVQYMKSSKYCICPRGYEVNSPRIVEAIMHECVPVIISDNYVPPFFEVLNWDSFAVFVLEKDIPNLKNILLSIPEKRYRQMQLRVKKVQQHFLWHARPVKYDLFHMVLHSVWYNRVFQMQPR